MIWFSCLLLLGIAIGFVLWPLCYTRHRLRALSHIQVDERVVAYRQRILALSEGCSKQTVDDADQQVQLFRLKRDLLNELTIYFELFKSHHVRWIALISVGFIVIASSVIYQGTGHYRQLALWQDAMTQLPVYTQRLLHEPETSLTDNQRRALMLGLRTKLADAGDHVIAWLLLGRVAMSLQEYVTAGQAFEKGLAISPQHTQVLMHYSQLLLMGNSNEGQHRAVELLRRVLRTNPNNIDALFLLGLIGYELGDWHQAIVMLEKVRTQLPEADPRYQVVSRKIEQMRQD